MSPEDYRTKWGLPKDYPMVAPNYSASRSALAKSMGLGRVAKAAAAQSAKARAAKAAARVASHYEKATSQNHLTTVFLPTSHRDGSRPSVLSQGRLGWGAAACREWRSTG